jgi:CheY-like chemotaxis protein
LTWGLVMDLRGSGTRRRSALVVSDDAETREMYRLYLSTEGFAARDVPSPKAFETARNVQPDVIMADISPPVADVLGVCQDLKYSDSTRGILVIAVTGYTNAQLIDAAARVGCVSVLMKPCAPEALLAEIHRVLHISPATSSR